MLYYAGAGGDTGVEPREFSTDIKEARFVARRIQQLTDLKSQQDAPGTPIYKLHEVAVLYRTKMQVTVQSLTILVTRKIENLQVHVGLMLRSKFGKLAKASKRTSCMQARFMHASTTERADNLSRSIQDLLRSACCSAMLCCASIPCTSTVQLASWNI